MELNDEVSDGKPGLVIYSEPPTRHRLWSAAGVRTIVVGAPAYRLDDEFNLDGMAVGSGGKTCGALMTS